MQTRTQKVRVIAAVVDTKQLTLYKEDGTTMVIPQGDPRLAEIIKVITPVLAQGPGYVAEVEFPLEDDHTHIYRDYEKNHGNGIRFFKVAKSKLAGLLKSAINALEPEAPKPATITSMVLGMVPTVPAKPVITGITSVPAVPLVGSKPVAKTSEQDDHAAKMLSVAEEIIANAKPASAPDFNDKNTGDEGGETIVAVIGKNVVAGVEKLKPQMIHASKNANAKGLNRFMARIAKVADKRRHSVEDLMKFLDKGDLPIADDGSIVIYKVLRKAPGSKLGGYVDCHTRQVNQQVGSYVCMDEKLVDHDRRVECSNGLHVARRQYVGNFSGDVITLCKVKPEDVIAVPDHDANKMRVCGYHILFELSPEAFSKLKSNRPFTDTEDAQLLLGRALCGDHDEPMEEVRIMGQQGTGVVITPLSGAAKASAVLLAEPAVAVLVTPVETALASVAAIKPKALAADFITTTDKPGLVAAVETTESVQKSLSILAEPIKGTPVKRKAAVVVKPAKALVDPTAKVVHDAPAVNPKAVISGMVAAKAEVESRSQKAQRLCETFNKAKTTKAKLEAATALLAFKKSVKLGWSALNISESVVGELQGILK